MRTKKKTRTREVIRITYGTTLQILTKNVKHYYNETKKQKGNKIKSTAGKRLTRIWLDREGAI